MNLPSFNHKTICLLGHVGEGGLSWLFVLIFLVQFFICYAGPNANFQDASWSMKVQVTFKTGEP